MSCWRHLAASRIAWGAETNWPRPSAWRTSASTPVSIRCPRMIVRCPLTPQPPLPHAGRRAGREGSAPDSRKRRRGESSVNGESRILQCLRWEVQAMQVTVTLRGRARFAALLHRLEQETDQRGDAPRIYRRNRRTWRQLVLGVLVKRSTRLLALGQIVAPQRRARSVKAAAQGLAYV